MNAHFLSLFLPTFGLVCLTVVLIQLAVVWLWKRCMDVTQPRGETCGTDR